jgi:hypothetical protein
MKHQIDVKEELKTIRATADLPTVGVSMDEDMIKLAHDSRDILGYQPLHRKAVAGGSRLANVLIELGIEVLSPTAILKYQDKLGRPNPQLTRLVQLGEGLLGDEELEYNDDDEEDDDEEEEDAGPKMKRATNMTWTRIEIGEYKKPIPAHVLIKSIEIKKALPTTQFMVEELQKMPDPFLIALFGTEQFYIEVWEEPKFEKRATKDGTSSRRNPNSRG